MEAASTRPTSSRTSSCRYAMGSWSAARAWMPLSSRISSRSLPRFMGTAKFTLVLLRHGQSTWNLENLFTGWHDVPLSPHGVEEAVEAGRLMKSADLWPDVVHTSVLVRAIDTADLGRP